MNRADHSGSTVDSFLETEGIREEVEAVALKRVLVWQRARKSATYRKGFARTLHQIDLALLVREMREDAGLTQAELAKKVGTTQSVIARLEDAEYSGHSLAMLERIATACGVALKLHAEKTPNFDREVALV